MDGGGAAARVLGPARDAFTSATGAAFRIAALLLVLGAVASLAVERRAAVQQRTTAVSCSAYCTSATTTTSGRDEPAVEPTA